jgi:hypothetical protein
MVSRRFRNSPPDLTSGKIGLILIIIIVLSES